jgi:UDP-GlcNAc:undecaprenyl-phosphate/decaprenyl-phosphate GlcNAc-1-phosphate transferase
VSFLVAVALAAVLTPAARWLGHAIGLLDRPGEPLKIHSEPVPVLGGWAVMAAALTAPAIVGHPVPVAVVAAVLLMLAGGTVDDLKTLRPPAKLLLQAVVAGILVVGFQPDAAGAVALVVLVLGCTNAVNVVDGQDGLAGGLAAVAAVGFGVVLEGVAPERAALAFAFAGALCAFLVWNRPPARIFLGNGGAYAVGTLLAALAAMAVDEKGAAAVPPALLCLGVFLFDLAFTVVRRIGRSSLATGDRLHSYDLLSVALRGRGRATLAFIGIGALATGLAVIGDASATGTAVALAIGSAGAAGVCGHLLWSRRLRA